MFSTSPVSSMSDALTIRPVEAAASEQAGTPADDSIVSWLSAPVSAASLSVYRILFGVIASVWVVGYISSGRLELLCNAENYHFTYPGFGWVRPWPKSGMLLEFLVLLVAALHIAAGVLVRFASIVFAIGFTHFFLIDRTNYQNHYYLVMLLSWLMVLIPADRYWSLAAVDRAGQGSSKIPRWALLMVQFHIALPYVFGGIAKLDSDWLSGIPMSNVIRSTEPFGIDSSSPWIPSLAMIFTWGGLFFDLLIVPALLWRRSRATAFVLLLCFHGTNSLLFDIHVFPWMMIGASTLFFAPDWPHRFLWGNRVPLSSDMADVTSSGTHDPAKRIGRPLMVMMTLWGLLQIVLPFRHLLYEGNTGWTERGHYFSWRMMLRGKTTGLRYFLVDGQTDRVSTIDIRQFLNPEQEVKFSRDPAMIADFGRFLGAFHHQRTGQQVRVHVVALSSLNGRKPQLLIDPAVNLTTVPRFAFRTPWIVPLTEPLRTDPWTVSVELWLQQADLPENLFAENHTHNFR